MSSQLSELKRSEKEASTLINKYKLKEPPISVVDIAKNLGINVVPYDLGDGVSGILVVEANKATIGYSNWKAPCTRESGLNRLPRTHFFALPPPIVPNWTGSRAKTGWRLATPRWRSTPYRAREFTRRFSPLCERRNRSTAVRSGAVRHS